MRSVSNQCLLMQIQPTILRFAKMLASVLQLEVEIVDADMVRVAGTGPYGKFFGRQLEGDSRLRGGNAQLNAHLELLLRLLGLLKLLHRLLRLLKLVERAVPHRG